MGWKGSISVEIPNVVFDPFNNANDLMMVLEKFDSFMILKDGETQRYTAMLSNKHGSNVETKDTLPHAVLEAALKAMEVKE